MDPEFSSDVADIAERLQAQRPELDPIELDGVRARVAARAVAERPKRRSGRRAFLGSRFAVTALLSLGIVLGTTGAGLAVSGLSGAGSAGQGQYEQPGDEGGEVSGVVQGDTEPGAKQTTGQVAAIEEDGGDLPFTGILVIPLILTGVAMLATGLVLRRRA